MCVHRKLTQCFTSLTESSKSSTKWFKSSHISCIAALKHKLDRNWMEKTVLHSIKSFVDYFPLYPPTEMCSSSYLHDDVYVVGWIPSPLSSSKTPIKWKKFSRPKQSIYPKHTTKKFLVANNKFSSLSCLVNFFYCVINFSLLLHLKAKEFWSNESPSQRSTE